MIRILLVDDHFLARLGLHSLLDGRDDLAIIADAHNGAEAIELHRLHHPDVTIMDLRLPGLSGFDAIRAIRADFPGARIVVLSNYEGSEDVHQALEAGAMAYLVKNAPGEQLLEAILAVHRGARYLPPQIRALLAERSPADELTARELEVLHQLALGCSNKEIATALAIAENTARVHVARVLEKLGVEDRTQAVIAAFRRGLVHIPQRPPE